MKLDNAKKLHQKKYREQFGHYLVEGEHLILELDKAALSQPYLKETILYVTEEYQAWAQQLNHSYTITAINKKQMAGLSDTKTPQGIIACVPLPTQAEKTPLQNGERCIYLHEVQDPGNLGHLWKNSR